jgi:FkbM family methyltransferase
MRNFLHMLRKLFFTKQFRFSYGQFGEDIPVFMLFRKRKNDRNHGFFVDVGAYHPTKWSNTFYLYKRGWRGINIDMEPLKIQAFNIRRPGDINICQAISDDPQPVKIYSHGPYTVGATIDKETGKQRHGEKTAATIVHPKTLTEVIDETRFKDQEIDFLNVDAEGHDLNVLKALDFDRYHPKVIAVEIYGHDIEAVIESDIHKFLKEKGYHYLNRVSFTSIYGHPDFIGDGMVFA